MSVNTKSPIKRGQNNFFATKAPNNLLLNNKTIKTTNNSSNITPKVNSTPQIINNSDQSTPNHSTSNLKTNDNQISFASIAAKTRNPKKEQGLIIEIIRTMNIYMQ